jgi:hypothetical protein
MGVESSAGRQTLRWVQAAWLMASVGIWFGTNGTAGSTPQKIDFDRDIRPIFSENCFACHGPDEAKRKAGLRLDLKDSVFKPAKSGAVPIIPGKADQSVLIQKVSSTDDDERMPPPKSEKRLTPAQVELLRRWVEQGAEYRRHWAFLPPQRPPVPSVKQANWPRNPIDAFILARLEKEGLPPRPEANRRTLIRRLSLDLVGLPPTPEEVDAFLADESANAYEQLVERLLASPHYGERMAVDWLDAARYADTHGYHIDPGRDMTHWRDWVIRAYNQNLPFDKFTIEQLAGDLLPNPTTEQKIASGFNRNNMINFEGGAIPEEYQTAYVVDRVNTTSTTWLGLTVACAQCHDHKFDPVTQKDYYRFYAFFNHVPENGLDGQRGNAVPLLRLPTPKMEAALAKLSDQLKVAEDASKKLENDLPDRQAAWEKQFALAPAKSKEGDGLLARFRLEEGALFSRLPNGVVVATHQGSHPPVSGPGKMAEAIQLDGEGESFAADVSWNWDYTNGFSFGAWLRSTEKGGAVLSKMATPLRGFDLLLKGGKIGVDLISQLPDNTLQVQTKEPFPKDVWFHVLVTYDGSSHAEGLRIYVNGRQGEVEAKHDKLTGTILNSAPLRIGGRPDSSDFAGAIDDLCFYDRCLTQQEAEDLAGEPYREIAAIRAPNRTEAQQQELRRYFKEFQDPAFQHAQQEVARLRQAKADFDHTIPTTMVMQEMATPRDTFILIRGQYDKHGDKVTPGVPAFLGPWPEGAPTNRLGLAKWLVSPDQPLTARVIVNRYWQMYFGVGLVKTAEDFGSQGEYPSHPELLDWLASEFVRSGWDVKAMQRLIVESATYRQTSSATSDLVAKDPENRLLARGPRLRLPAEFIRDQALAISGLLNSSIGGASVSPYQPSGLWEELAYRDDGRNWTAQTYEQSHGAALYRRTMYTFWKRTSPPPTLTTFDAPDRETCVVRRPRTNTPLQALVLMNDPTYIEAARKLAERLMTEAAGEENRIDLAFRLALARPPGGPELKLLVRTYEAQHAAYEKDLAGSLRLLNVGEAPRNEQLDPPELAAWTIIANIILNLDETITKS